MVRPCTGKWAPKHLPTVVYTRRVRDLFRKRWWVRCWLCEMAAGPYPDRGFAHLVQVDLEPWGAPHSQEADRG